MAETLIEIKFDGNKLRRLENVLRGVPRGLPKVVSRAINKTAVTAKTQAAREIAGETKLKISEVKSSIALHKASYSRWQAEIGIAGRRIPLFQFGARQTKKGVTYRIDSRSGRKLISSAFIATMESGHTGVFKRTGAERLPIIELFGPSLRYVFETSGDILKKTTKTAYKNLEHNIDVQVKLILGRKAS